ncbi:outer membrane porin, OprD family, partial [Azotobacter beijerinckii]
MRRPEKRAMNRKSTLTLAVVAGTLGLPMTVQEAAAAGFIEDSKATLGFRTFYMNQDDRNSDRPRIDETGQAFLFEYKSGFTEGFVGFGLDVIAQEGVRLDGGGRAGKAGAERAPGAGSMFPLKSNGKSQEDYGRLNATGKMRISKTIAEVGVLRPTLPILKSNDGRLLPQLFHGAQVTSNEFSNLTFVGGRLEHSTERNSTDSQALFIGGAANNQRSNEFYYGGVDYKATKALTLQYYYSNLDDFYEQHFFGLVHNWALPVGALKSDLRYWTSNSDGANGSSSGRAEGYRSSGYWGSGSSHKGEVDNDTL